MSLARFIAALLLAPLLSACWMTKEPLIGTDNASQVAFAGPYRPDGHDVEVRAEHNPDGSYRLTDGKEGFTAFYREVAPGWYLVQLNFRAFVTDVEQSGGADGTFKITVPEGDGPWLYNLVHVGDDALRFYRVTCDPATKAIPGVTNEQSADELFDVCTFPGMTGLEQAAFETIDRIGKGTFAGETNVMKTIR